MTAAPTSHCSSFPNWLREHQWGTLSLYVPTHQGADMEDLKPQDPSKDPLVSLSLTLSPFKRQPSCFVLQSCFPLASAFPVTWSLCRALTNSALQEWKEDKGAFRVKQSSFLCVLRIMAAAQFFHSSCMEVFKSTQNDNKSQ